MTFLLTACGDNIKVTQDYDPAVNFSVFSSYNFVAFEDDEVTTITQNRVKKALSEKLKSLSFTQLTDAEADVLVAYHIFSDTRQKQRVTTTGSGFNYYGGGYYGRGYYGPSINMTVSHVDTIDYKVGTLVVDFVDPKTRNVLYHATAETTLSDARTPQDREKLIKAAVDKIFADYPPAPRQ